MSTTKISQLPVLTEITANDVLIVNDENSSTKTITFTNLVDSLPTSDISDLGGVDISGATNGQVLTYNGGSGDWSPTTISLQATIDYVLTANGTSAYRFSGPGLQGTEDNPTIYLMRGQTYNFQNGMGLHPFHIRDDQGNDYNNGVTGAGQGVTNGILVFEVPMDAPDTLTYVCDSHPAMTGTLQINQALTDFESITVDSGQAVPALTIGQELIQLSGRIDAQSNGQASIVIDGPGQSVFSFNNVANTGTLWELGTGASGDGATFNGEVLSTKKTISDNFGILGPTQVFSIINEDLGTTGLGAGDQHTLKIWSDGSIYSYGHVIGSGSGATTENLRFSVTGTGGDGTPIEITMKGTAIADDLTVNGDILLQGSLGTFEADQINLPSANLGASDTYLNAQNLIADDVAFTIGNNGGPVNIVTTSGASAVTINTASVSQAGEVTAAKFIGDGSLLTNLPTGGGAVAASNFTWDASIIPDTNATYDLGSAEFKVRHLFLSDNSIKFESGDVGITEGRLTYADVPLAKALLYQVNNAGNDSYVLDGPGIVGQANPRLHLTRGETYYFNNTMGIHPMEIRVSSEGAEYTDGVVDARRTDGIMSFTVPMDAPDTLVYQCTVHPAMVGEIYVMNDATTRIVDTNVPSTNTDAGVPGEIRYGNTFLYICVATNSWKRVALADF